MRTLGSITTYRRSTIRLAITTKNAARMVTPRTLGRSLAWIGSPDVAYLAAAAHGIAFHPPSRSSMSNGLVDYFTGYPIVVG